MTQDRLSRYLSRTATVYDLLVRYAFYASGVLVMALALSIGVNVVMRWLFDDSLTWIVEGGEYILLFVTFLASAHILHENGHARMLLLVERFSPQRARLLNLFSSVLGAIVSLVLAWVTTDSTLESIPVRQLLPRRRHRGAPGRALVGHPVRLPAPGRRVHTAGGWLRAGDPRVGGADRRRPRGRVVAVNAMRCLAGERED